MIALFCLRSIFNGKPRQLRIGNGILFFFYRRPLYFLFRHSLPSCLFLSFLRPFLCSVSTVFPLHFLSQSPLFLEHRDPVEISSDFRFYVLLKLYWFFRPSGLDMINWFYQFNGSERPKLCRCAVKHILTHCLVKVKKLHPCYIPRRGH